MAVDGQTFMDAMAEKDDEIESLRTLAADWLGDYLTEKSKVERLTTENKLLIQEFMHTHVTARNGEHAKGDECLECGFDLRHPIHIRVSASGSPESNYRMCPSCKGTGEREDPDFPGNMEECPDCEGEKLVDAKGYARSYSAADGRESS